MRLLPLLFVGIVAVFLYGISRIHLSLWNWIYILSGLGVLLVFVLPHVLAWIINLFLSKGKRFSMSVEKLSPLSMQAKNIQVTVYLKKMHLSISVKKVTVRTNIKNYFLNAIGSSPFVLDIDTVSVGMIPSEGSVDEAKPSSPSAPPTPLTPSTPLQPTEHSLPSSIEDIGFIRYIIVLFRLLDVRLNSLLMSIGDAEFPKRIEIYVLNLYLNGSVQFSPITSVNTHFTIGSISLNNRENAFDSQPNVLLRSFKLQCASELGSRLLIRQFTWTVGEYLHVRLDKSLYRQAMAVMKALHRGDSPSTPAKAAEPEKSEEKRKAEVVEKLGKLIRLMPQGIQIVLPKLELELVNADKSSNVPSSITIVLGVSLRGVATFYDPFALTPRGVSLTAELLTLQSSFLTCEGLQASVSVMLRDTSRFESVSLSYNHKKTALMLHPSIFHTAEYVRSLLLCFPKKTTPKPKKPSLVPVLTSLVKESTVKVDMRVEELQLALMTSTLALPIVETSLQAVTLTCFPASNRTPTENSFSLFYELQMKIGAIEARTVPYSRDGLMNVLEANTPRLPPCSEKMVALGGIEVDCTVNKWERVSLEMLLKSCNLAFTYSTVDLVVFIVEKLMREMEEFCRRSIGETGKTASFFSLASSPSPSTASFKSSDAASFKSSDAESFKTPLPLGDAESPSEGISLSPPVEVESFTLKPMNSEDINHRILHGVLTDSLFPMEPTGVSSIDDCVIAGPPFTPSSSPSPTHRQEQTQTTMSKPISPTSSTPRTSDQPALPTQETAHSKSESDDSDDDTILLSDEEINASAKTSYRFLPIFLTDLSLRVNSVEVQITGEDTSRSTSYTMESLTVTLSTKNIDNLGALQVASDPILGNFGETLSEEQYGSYPVYAYSRPADEGDLPVKKPSLHFQPSVNLDMIPLVDETHLPSAPVSHPLPSYTPQHLDSLRRFDSEQPYLKNPVVEYQVVVEITNVSIIGDDRVRVPKSSLPLFIPQIRLTLPAALFLSLSQSELPDQLESLSIRSKNTEYKAFSLGPWSGFHRGEERMVLVWAQSCELNCLQLEVSSLFVRLAFGSIYVVISSLRDLIGVFKRSSIGESLKTIRELKKKKKAPKSAKKQSLFQFTKVAVSIQQLRLTFHFTPKEGVLLAIEEITASYPDSSALPLIALRNLQATKIQMMQAVYVLGSVESITVYSPSNYSEMAQINDLETKNAFISDLRDRSQYLRKCSCGHCDLCHRYCPCSTCQQSMTDPQQCNGYDSQCNLRLGHVPDGVKPFLVFINKIDLLQDMRWTWGDLIYDACLQWKAFKTVVRGPRAPPPFPSPDEERVKKVADHEPFSSCAMLDGIWIQLIVDSLCLRIQDIIPYLSPDSREYSCLVVNGIDGVLTYNKKCHSRAHFLSFIQSMDDSPTPFAKGFDDVLGMHVHDLYIDSLETSFVDQPPMCMGYNLFACGTFVLADMNRVQSYIRYETVDLFCSTTFDAIPVQVTRSSISTKIYQNFNVQASKVNVFWGNALYWVRNSFTDGLAALTPRGCSKSPKLPWYDKIRFNVHGPLSFQVFESFHVDWVTYHCVGDQYESLVIEFTNPCLLFRKQGGCSCEFDVFSIGVSKFNDLNQLVLYPIFQAVEGAWIVNPKWCNKESSNHYVELNTTVTDDSDKYYLFRSNTIEWDIQLGPYNNRDFKVSFFVRGELNAFLSGFWNMLMTPDPDIPDSHGPGIMRNSTDFEVRFLLDNSNFWT